MDKGNLIGQGRTADVFAWGSDRVLKLYFSWMPRGAVEREYRATRAASQAGIPVPAAEELVEHEGRSGIVFERVEGPSLLKSLGEHPLAVLTGARLMGELHAKIHAVDAPEGLPVQRAQIERGILEAQGLPEALRSTCLARLAQFPAGTRLCHGDFHPDNILLTARGPVILDWLNAQRGDPGADVARSMLILQTGGLPPGTPLARRILINLSRRLLVSGYVRRYQQLHPIPPGTLESWQAPLLAARLSELNDYPREKDQVLARLRKSLAGEAAGRQR